MQNNLTKNQMYAILSYINMIEAHFEMSTERVKAFARRCGWKRFECRRRSRRKIGLAKRENIRFVVAEMRRAILFHRDLLR